MAVTVPQVQRHLGWGLTALVALMPFYAFLSVWLGSTVGNQAYWQAIKEGITLILAGYALYYVFRKSSFRERLNTRLTVLIGLFALVAVVVTAIRQPDPTGAIFGLKTDFEFLVLFLVAILAGTKLLTQRLIKTVIITSTIAAVIGLALVTILPQASLTVFGYGPSTISPYAGVAAGIDAIRTPSTLGGPNQFGSFLILPLCLTLGLMMRRFRPWHPAVLAILAGGIWVSYSRAALLGAVGAVIITILASLPLRQALKAAAISAGILAFAGTFLFLQTGSGSKLQYYVLHQSAEVRNPDASTSQHITSALEGVEELAQDPLGDGLGTSGPASFRTDDPFIPESGFLQLGLETGIAGLLLFLGICLELARRLYSRRLMMPNAAVLGALAGLSVVNLVLHGWADASTAFVFWIIAGVTLGVHYGNRHEGAPE